MKIAVYAGSFDPVTKGHQDVIKKALELTDKLIIVVVGNSNKKTWFSLEERKNMIEKVMEGHMDKIEIDSFDGLLVDYMKEKKVNIIIRGLRAVSDYEYELGYAFTNNELSGGKVHTVFIPASREYMYLSSSGVREAATAGAPLDIFVDKKLIDMVMKRAIENKNKIHI